MKARVQKWGNSLAIRIPRPFAEDLGVAQGTEVDLSVEDHELVVRPTLAVRVSLAELLERITDDNLHDEIGATPQASAAASR